MCVCFKDDYCNINDESSQVPVRWIAWESLLDVSFILHNLNLHTIEYTFL